MTRDHVRTVLSDNIKKLRNRREWTQQELAKKANISMNFLSEIERGRKWPYPETLQSLAEALNVEIFEFFIPKKIEAPSAIEAYMNRFSTDMAIALEKSVQNTLFSIKQKYGQASLQ
jgi:transcriptional regulator with XRE-family HTH domain